MKSPVWIQSLLVHLLLIFHLVLWGILSLIFRVLITCQTLIAQDQLLILLLRTWRSLPMYGLGNASWGNQTLVRWGLKLYKRGKGKWALALQVTTRFINFIGGCCWLALPGAMSLLVWNYRGLGSLVIEKELGNLTRLKDPSVVLFAKIWVDKARLKKKIQM